MDDYKSISKIINSIYQISDISMKEIEKLIIFENHKKNKIFIYRNRSNENEYFVLSGICKSFISDKQGNEITLSFFTDNSVITPNNIRTTENISSMSFKALTDLKLATIDAIKFQYLMRNHNDIRNFAITVLQNDLIKKNEKEIELASLSAKERLIKFRRRYPNLENQIPHSDIASYLGITNISLSRLRKDLIR
jgi:CRP-like cAMP-binding protein